MGDMVSPVTVSLWVWCRLLSPIPGEAIVTIEFFWEALLLGS